MNTIVVVIHVLAVVVLVLTVLLQAGKGAGMGAAFGGSSSVFGARGPATLIGKITCAAAVVFMCTSLYLAVGQGGLKTESVMSGYVETQAAEPAPADPAEQEAGTGR
ncbi:MAG: preprotein translocase subunit SecG [Deltaproteobacteria bacterium]|nr:preprotein translocase subunit SecG [Deltaproteobacteria bacterium]